MNLLHKQFLVEARKHLTFVGQNIDKIGDGDHELLDAVFRSAHTLKGSSSIVGHETIRWISHYTENVLSGLREGKIEFCEEMIEPLRNAFDEIATLVEASEECDNIVECDKKRMDEISQSLSALMGTTIETKRWVCPFTVTSDAQRIINLSTPFLRHFTTPIPFTRQPCDELFCSQEHLYAVVFNIDPSCMVYGNDPIYMLSLIWDKVIGVYSNMSDETAVSILNGTDDPEGLLLKISMVAFIYASYGEISDALFNFAEELTYLPLDIETLLSIDVGHSGCELDSEFTLSTMDTLNRDEIVRNIRQAILMMDKEMVQYSQLNRILDVVGMVADVDLPKFAQMITQAPFGVLLRTTLSRRDNVNNDGQ